ncbi:MAG: SIS domain-containing protein [Verrucomicrobia bacterium]|nr:SIS domain-containing protein [Verrucomicrobiota bacterium]
MSTDFASLFKTHLSEHQDAIAKLNAMSDQIAPLAAAWLTALKDGKKIIFFGNGGSAADAQHLAAELVVRYRINRPAMAGLALTTDTSILTAHSNDFGYDTVFSRQIEALAQPGDVVLGISTSGTSKNVLLGLQAANARGCVTIAFTGEKGADCAAEATLSFKAPSAITARVQECHLLIGHLLCDIAEQSFAAA